VGDAEQIRDRSARLGTDPRDAVDGHRSGRRRGCCRGGRAPHRHHQRPHDRQPLGTRRGLRLGRRHDPVRHAPPVLRRGPLAGAWARGGLRAEQRLHGVDLHPPGGRPLERRHAPHGGGRRLHLPVRDRQQHLRLPELLPLQPDLRDARWPDADLALGAPHVRPGDATLRLHHPEAHLGALRRQGPQGDPQRPEHAERGERSVHPDPVGARTGLDDGAQPVLLGTDPRGRSSRVPRLRQPGGPRPGP